MAAASLDQTLDAEDVVADYFAKAGLSDKLKSVSVDEGVNYRTVTADAKAVSQNFFMSMVGIDSIDAPAASIAEQRITNVEIALALDISGSMYVTPSRIANLKVAAKDFVDTVLAKDTAEQNLDLDRALQRSGQHWARPVQQIHGGQSGQPCRRRGSLLP